MTLYRLEGHDVVSCTERGEWCRWFEHANREVARTTFADVDVSTVFIGIDYRFGEDGPPLVFETRIFKGAHAGQWRYSTWDEAVAGHEHAVAVARGDVMP